MLCLQEVQNDTKLPVLWSSLEDFCTGEMPKPQQAVAHHWRTYRSVHWEEVLEVDKGGVFRLCSDYVEKEKMGISHQLWAGQYKFESDLEFCIIYTGREVRQTSLYINASFRTEPHKDTA